MLSSSLLSHVREGRHESRGRLAAMQPPFTAVQQGSPSPDAPFHQQGQRQ